MKKLTFVAPLLAGVAIAAITVSQVSCTSKAAEETKQAMTGQEMIEHGKYLVMSGGCHDCHSPKVMTPGGPELDTTRLLSGSPENMPLPHIDTTAVAPGKWYLGSSDLTAWVGPWGISYAANLTPDTATGIGIWTEELFIKMLRTGKFMGVEAGRPIMPPMPWKPIGMMKDEDLKCIFAYLKSLKPVHNRVPGYVPPTGIADINKAKLASN